MTARILLAACAVAGAASFLVLQVILREPLYLPALALAAGAAGLLLPGRFFRRRKGNRLSWEWAAAAFLAVTSAGLITEGMLYSVHTPGRAGHLRLGKALLPGGLMAVIETRGNRHLFHRNHLNLHAWHGFQEVLFERAVSPASMEFRFRLQREAYVNAIVGKTVGGFSGVRLSRDERFPSQVFRADAAGGFLETRALPGVSIDGAWHKAAIAFEGGHVAVRIDGRDVGRVPWPAPEVGLAGLRGGLWACLVDDVVIRNVKGRDVVVERFANHDHWLRAFAVALILSFGLLAAVVAKSEAAAQAPQNAAFAMFMLAFMSAAVLFFDVLFWSKQYHFRGAGLRWELKPTPAESTRRFVARFFTLLDPVRNDEFHATYPLLKAPYDPAADFLKGLQVIQGDDPVKIVPDHAAAAHFQGNRKGRSLTVYVAGTSQTEGQGAAGTEDRWVTRVHRGLVRRFGPKIEVTTVNGARVADLALMQLKRYQGLVDHVRPDLMIVNLSNNDRDIRALEAHVGSMLEINAKRGVRTLLVLEANTPELADRPIALRHAALRRLGTSRGVPVFDLHGALGAPSVRDSGFLWWDWVHMTSHGHRQAAEALLPVVAAEARKALGNTAN